MKIIFWNVISETLLKEDHGKDREAFNSLIQELTMIDLPLTERSFTWTNMQDDPCLARPDRVLISPSWENLYRLASV